MDTTCHQTSAYRTQEKLPRPDHRHHEQDDHVVHMDEPDLFAELQAFAEAEDDTVADDATASVTDSCATDFENDSLSDDSFSSQEEDSCCTLYDDEQDLACLAEAACNSSAENTKRGVRFSIVEIREYACTIGDHPCVRDSCPISLDWQYARAQKRDINSYENSRFFMRSSYPRKLLLDERRRRIRETSRLSRRSLRELELDVAMQRLEVSKERMYDFWGDFDQQQTYSDPEGFWRGDNAIESA